MAKLLQTNQSARLGQRLARLRNAVGSAQVELAVNPGISRRTVDNYDSPDAALQDDLLPAIEAALRVSNGDLFGRATRRRLAKQVDDHR